MNISSNSKLAKREASPFVNLGSLSLLALSLPVLPFTQSCRAQSDTEIAISNATNNEFIRISFPTNSGFTAIQAEVLNGNLSSSNWFNVPGGLVSSNSTYVDIPKSLFPPSGCFFRGVSNNITSDIQIFKQPYNDGFPNSFVAGITADDTVLRGPDGKIDSNQLNHWQIFTSINGVNWTPFYTITPGGTQAQLVVHPSPSTPNFFMARVQHVPSGSLTTQNADRN